MYDLEAAKEENLRAQKALNDMQDLLSLIVSVSSEQVPQLKSDINDIVKNIKGGFDKEELAKQIRTVLNQVINQSDYSKLQANIDATAKKMIDAVETSSRQVDHWRDNYHSRRKWHIALISGVLGVLLGAGLLWWLQNSRIDRYQVAISQTNAMAGYINSDCKIKQSYAKFVGDSITCDKKWASPSFILGRKN